MADRQRRLELTQVKSPKVRRLQEYWREKGERRDSLPWREDIEPSELRDLLPHMIIVGVEHEPLRFRYRLVGTRIVEFSHHDFTGRYLGTMGWAEEEALIEAYTSVATKGQPSYGAYVWELLSGAAGTCEFALFPLTDEQGQVSHILAIEDFDFPLMDIDPDRNY